MALSYATIEEIYVSSRRIHTMIRLLWQKKYCSSSMLDILPCRRDHLWQQNAFGAKYSSVESEKVTLSLFFICVIELKRIHIRKSICVFIFTSSNSFCLLAIRKLKKSLLMFSFPWMIETTRIWVSLNRLVWYNKALIE